MKNEIKGIKESATGNVKTKALDKLAGEDKELRDKIELEFDNYKSDDVSEKGIVDRMSKAFTLATGDAPKPNFMDNITGAGSEKGSSESSSDQKEKPTENEKEIGKKLGVSEKDSEKFRDAGDQMTPPEPIE